MDQLAAMRAFVRIVDTGSFTRAAQVLAMPKATMTKLVQSLEAHLRTTLLNRTTRRVTVTTDGAAYYERSLRLLADLDELDGSMMPAQAHPRGRLRIDVPVSLGQQVILPALPDFLAAYPDIELEMGLSDRPADMAAENVDCVIRGGEIADQSLIARRLASLRMVACAAPGYLARRGVPAHPRELETGHEVVGYMSPATGRPRGFVFIRGAEQVEVSGHRRLAVNETSTYLLAGLAGFGVIQTVEMMARPHLDAGTLRLVLPDWELPPVPIHVVYPPNRHLSNRTRVFVDWVAGLFAAPALGRRRPA
jgi:DNA-binding transcriptional LysR family regulator